MHRLIIGCLLLCSVFVNGFGQGEIAVDMYTGQPQIFIDLYTLKDHDLVQDFKMKYTAGVMGSVGFGWNLDAVSYVSRETRGLPDDFADATRSGWLYNSNYSGILSFSNTADLSKDTYSDELSDYNYLNGLQYKQDTEPDIYTYQVGNVGGRFMFNNSGGISLIPYQDISIVPTYSGVSPATKTITGWTITTNSGTVYTFNDAHTVTRSIQKSDTDYQNDQSGLNLFDKDFNQYSTAVTYNSNWSLSAMKSYTGASITYSYKDHATTSTFVRSAWQVDASYPSNSVTTLAPWCTLMKESLSMTTKILTKVQASSGSWVLIDYTYGVDIYDPLYSSIQPFKRFKFAFQADNPVMLSSITETGRQCASMPPFKFEYFGVPTNQTDLWGYCNSSTNVAPAILPKFPTIYVYPNEPASERYRLYRIPSYTGTEVIVNGNSDRTPNGFAVLGTLTRIIYPSGGESDFVFENNEYQDPKGSVTRLGGGLRIRQIDYFDGVNPNAKITKVFEYKDANGLSSGRLIKRPAFAVPLWEFIAPKIHDLPGGQIVKSYSTLNAAGTAPLWRGLTAIVNFDLNNSENTNGSAVGYSQVTVTRPGSGKAVYNYYVPGAYGDAATGTGATDWSPTTMKFVRQGNWDMSILKSGEAWGYPAFNTQLYDYERGLVWKKAEYNNANALVRLTQTSYQYVYKTGSTPTSIVSVNYDRFANSTPNVIYLYGRFTQLADVAKVVSTETVTTYDENSSSKNSTETTQNFFTASNHRYLTKTSRTTSDGTVYSKSFQYVPDYPYSGVPADSTLWMIKLLKDQNRTSTIIEQINTVTPAGGTEKTTAASLVKYRPVSINSVLTPFPRYELKFRPSVPGSFTRSSSSSNVFVHDSNYKVTSTVNEYNSFGTPISITDENRNTSGSLLGFNQTLPVATFSDVRSISIGLSDFETTTASGFSISNGYYGAGRTGKNGVHPYATISRTIVKPASATAYILSFWAKPASGNTSITLQVTMKNTGGTALSANNYTFNYKPGNTDYQYFTQVINVSTLPSTFIINVQGQSFTQPSASAPSLLPLLDDIMFYPDYAAVSTVAYAIPWGVNATTNPYGISTFSAYDSLGRVALVYDKDHNIKERYTYAFDGQVLPTLVADIINPSPYYVNTQVKLSAASNPCINNVTYAWDFDNQNNFITSGVISPAQTYSSTGNHTATVKVSHPDYGVKTASINFSIINPPPPQLAVYISNTYSSPWATFTATVYNGDDAVKYQWKQRNAGTSAWTNVGTSSPTYTVKVLMGSGTSIDVMCTVTTGDNRTANSLTSTISY
ncbi:MAG TPA: PKD domain-containing protein [Ohtaekwangia sp.]|uniref:PKD domain-containing protein n=2 Tax=Ohtaekwangia sp. TaxID=2066019 RepID=UPI002F93E7FF